MYRYVVPPVLMSTCFPALQRGSAALITQNAQWMFRPVYTHHNDLHSPPSLTATTSPSLCLSRRVFTLFTTAELLFITFHYALEGDSQLFTTNQHTQTNIWCTQTHIHISILWMHLEPCQDLSYKLHSWSENDF